LGEPVPTPVLGIDETRRGKPRWERCAETGRWLRVDPYDTGFIDLAGDQGLLGQCEGRSGAAVITWLSQRTPQFRESVTYWRSIPPRRMRRRSAPPGCCRTRRSWLITFVKLANDALTKVRRRLPESCGIAAAANLTPSGPTGGAC